jgi:hypothetical protein
MNLLTRVLFSMALLAPAAAHAAAGQMLFALGRVEIQRGAQTLPAARGTPVEVGDVISTGPTGLAQVRLQDGALLSLRYGSSMKVEEYRMPAPVAAAPAPIQGAQPARAVGGGRSVLRLLRGAFRTVTGLIGRDSGDTYSVITPVATIGIRGTDYSAAYCNGDCGSSADGLYLGVSNGGIEVFNDAGKLDLANDQYGYVKDNATAPDRELAPPEVLDAPIPPGEGDGEDEGREGAETAGGASAEGTYGDADQRSLDTSTQPEGDYEVRPGAAGRYAAALGSTTLANTNGVYLDDARALTGFLDGEFHTIGTAQNVNLGADPVTGLRWGRWSGGTASVGGSPLDLTNASLHWIYSTESSSPALAITGTRSYSVVGNTNPTDDSGTVGFLADATLFANFTNQTVDSTLEVGFGDAASGGTIWQALGSGSIASGTFDGSYTFDSVNCANCGVSVTDASGNPLGTGGGAFSGFFTSGGDAAGMTFSLTFSSTTVNGAVAFEGGPSGGVGAP